MAQFRTSRAFDFIFLAILAGLLFLAAANRVAVGDWVFFLSYHPDAETAQIAADAGLSPEGRHLFYRTNPQFVNQSDLNSQCSPENLGCINSKNQVFILDDPGKHDQTVVTAAHEMLHLAYRRLPESKKQELAPLIDQAISMNAAGGIKSELAGLSSPDDIRDEAHSLLGSEYKNLPPDLEQYYAQYFADRSKVVAAETASEN